MHRLNQLKYIYNDNDGHCYYIVNNVDMPNLVISLSQKPTFEWYVVFCGSKNGYIKKIKTKTRVFEEIRLCAQDTTTTHYRLNSQ